MGKLRKFTKQALLTVGVGILVFSAGTAVTSVQASKGDQGVDWSVYQGANGKWGYANDKFSISQIGGTTDGWNTYNQWTYGSQVRSTIAMGRRAHTYIWWQNVTNNSQAEHIINTFLPQVQTPKGSIIALDVESGAQNTYAVQHACDMIRNAGYTPMVYGYKNYLVNHVDLNYLASREQLWLAEYPNYSVTPSPNYNYFPSFNNVGIFQFTSTYVYGGLDGDVDLTGITDNGYKNGNPQKPNTTTPAINQGKQIHQDTHTYVVKSGDSWWSIAHSHGMDMNALAQLNGKTINNMLYPGQVLRVADSNKGNKVNNQVTKPVPQPHQSVSQTYTVRYGDSWWSIANRHNMSMYTLASINGRSINSMLYPGQVLKLNQVQASNNSGATWKDNLGVTWHSEKGTFTSNTWLHLRWGATPNSSSIAVLGPNSEIKYNAWARTHGFVYVRQPRSNSYGYIAVRNAVTNQPYGTFK